MTQFDIQPIAGVVYQGVGLGIVASVSMRTLDIMQQGIGQQPRRQTKRRKKQTEWTPPKMVFQELKLKPLKF